MKYPRKSIALVVLFCFSIVSFLSAGYYAFKASTTPLDHSPVDLSFVLPCPQPCFVDDGYDKEVKVEPTLIAKKKRRYSWEKRGPITFSIGLLQ